MKKYNLHYAKKELTGDIPCLKFNNIMDVIENLATETLPAEQEILEDTVLLCSYKKQIFVTQDINLLGDFILSMDDYEIGESDDIFIQEYDSYQACYEVSLDMMEENRLCYEPTKMPFYKNN